MMKINNLNSLPTTKTLGDFKPGDVVLAQFSGGGTGSTYYNTHYVTKKSQGIRKGDPLLIIDMQSYFLSIDGHERSKTDNVQFVNLRTGVLHSFRSSRIVVAADAELNIAKL